MKAGPLIAVVILAAYLGVEAYAFRKASHRMEPAYIHDLLVKANTATEACGNASTTALQGRFDQTLERVTDRLRSTLEADNTELDAVEISQLIADNTTRSLREVNEQLATNDCSDIEVQKHLRRFSIYAKKTR